VPKIFEHGGTDVFALLITNSQNVVAHGKGGSDRYYEFRAIDKKLTWRLVGPHGKSQFSAHLDGPPDP
jgi:hypothetical protein